MLKSRDLFIAVFVAICVSVAWIIAIGVYQATTYRLKAIAIDTPTAWSYDFTSTTGIPFFRVDAEAGNRARVDHVAVVGSQHPQSWFEQFGFEGIREDRAYAGEIFDSGTFLKGGSQHPVWEMTHPDAPKVLFYYLPEIGTLSCPGGLIPNYEN